MGLPASACCYQCQNPATICYTEVSRDKLIRVYVCADCPNPNPYYNPEESFEISSAGFPIILTCGNCNMTWSSRKDALLGCHQCYTNFKSLLVSKLQQLKAVSSSCSLDKSQGCLHVGRAPGEESKTNPLLKLIALNEALQDTLKREDYEQAAILRDQINTLKKQEDSHDAS